IVLADETEAQSVHGGTTSGNVTLVARGASSDITSAVDQDAIAAPGGSVTLTAGRDVSFGTAGLNFDNDVRARDNLTITAGRDVNVDGFADLASDGFGAATGGDVAIEAGRDINVLNVTGNDGSIGGQRHRQRRPHRAGRDLGNHGEQRRGHVAPGDRRLVGGSRQRG
ncbi:MAG: calcium-binding protein, partial [Ramlibacter sp.]|nr:calcium-binding protein [Ramlibacter sp.]